ncbi:MAG: hypothetical protein WA117_01625 [Verrucomicrobiia bacterium]
MKPLIASLLLAIPSLGFARMMEWWSEYKLFDRAELVAIAVPISTTNTAERHKLPEGFDVAGVETEFEVVSVTKGDKTLRKFVLHHYRLATEEVPANAPCLVSFEPKQLGCYVLHLVKERSGRYAPVNGQTDPAVAIYRKRADKPKPTAADFKSLHWIIDTTQQDIGTKKITYRAKEENWYKRPDSLLTIIKGNQEGFGTEYRYRRKEMLYAFHEGWDHLFTHPHNRYPAEEFERGSLGMTDAARDSQYKKIGSEPICGHPCDICDNIRCPGKDKVWLWKDNGMVLRRESVYSNGVDRASFSVSTVTKVEADIPVEDSLFELPARFKTKTGDAKPAK